MDVDYEEQHINKLIYCSCQKCGYVNKVIGYHDINYNCKKCGKLLENSLTYKILHKPLNLMSNFNLYACNEKIDKIAINMLMEIK